ncbi:M14 family metallopeptidase [Colwellia psychrerythraea]|uniref:Peptidase M14 carboxypeptidase A n=1 Tax=Colwellia psychrerythraea TaxID=28229 RepID=A0A099L3B6_COLPS|nr:M14 family metallopeptidase [Colwellia psychrerythraea]KGJ96940.1 peptidase M14 carboxypeptidase A [Colwellia psychrerythraea]
MKSSPFNKLLSGVLCASLSLLSITTFATVLMKPTANKNLNYPSLLMGNYNSQISTPKSVLGFEVGHKTATPEQINALVNKWARESNKANIVEYARTYEGRALNYLVISSAKNLNNLDKIKNNIAQLSRPKSLNANKIKSLINETPATAWMAYSIHGNESSGADSSLALIYHLLASEDADVTSLLDDLVILVDPMMNPDGRARFTKSMQEHRGAAPNVDSQSLLHSGEWPFGRGNHYLYDLNRDFYFAVNPESRGRIEAINQWYPLLMIDGHEMGAHDTYLFGPAREPINSNIPASLKRWGNIFAQEQAGVYDQKQWPYYTGEWFENLYPGYSNYSEYRGSINILYEQARTAEDGIKTQNGNIRTYKESVDHQFVSAIANLKSLQRHSRDIFNDFVKNRMSHVASKGKYANKSFVILPTDNTSRLNDFLYLLDLQGIEYQQTSKAQTVDDAVNHLGQTIEEAKVPKGSIIIQNRQYEAPLISAILEFDAKISDKVLLEERQKTLRDGSSIMYDSTAWNLSMMYGLAALEVPQHMTKNLVAFVKPASGDIKNIDNAIAYIVDGASDASVGYAARLMEQNVKVRILDKQGLFNKHSFNRGSIVVYLYDNTLEEKSLLTLIKQAAQDTGVQVKAINQGLGESDLPDIGGEYFKLLEQPQIALLSQNGINVEDLGSIWHMIDTQLGVRHSHLSHELLNDMDLRQYNVIVVPSRYYGTLSKSNISLLENWVKNGGSLIVNGNSAKQLANEEDFSQVKLLSDTFEHAADYNTALYREWLAQQKTITNNNKINAHKVATDLWFPWSDNEALKPMEEEQLTAWDDWSKNFMPSGAMVASRTDQKHWLTFGVQKQLPILTSNAPLFMAKDGANAVVRYGVLTKNKKAKAQQIGWSTTPKGNDLYIRMSGLIWPEASQRLANAAYLTQEPKGNGQIIMFANKPNFRGATKGTARLLLNAIVYGPGLGATTVIKL